LWLRFLFLCGFVFCNLYSKAQVRTKIFAPVSDTLVLDTAAVATVSVHVFWRAIELSVRSDYRFGDGFKSIIIQDPSQYDTLRIVYQTLPEWLLGVKKHREASISTLGVATVIQPENEGDLLHSEETVNTDGVLLRGISFGNAQDLVLNSSLNLRMRGRVSKDIEIEGAVTDQEFPFQPEGTTTTLQDFDRIYIALHMPHLSVLLGDYAFQSASGARFMKYAKKNRGLQLTGLDTIKKTAISWEVAAALARGRFSRNEINGIEGLQGPYRLTGSRGEQFVIVVSGTEVVYLDGQKMERGLQADYVIDYNAGEITFTPRHIINAFSRIVVEFQYSDRFYTRSVAGTSATFRRKKIAYYAGVYSEQDARNQPIQQDLDITDSTSGLTARDILRNAGDDPSQALFPGGRKLLQFSTSEPNYILRDTGSMLFYEYVETADTHGVFYRVNFSYVGPGNGTYILTGSTANGKVYRYVGTISGVPAGDYEPVSQIQPPNRLSMAEVGYVWSPRKETTISSNVSFSSNDKNLFSAKGDADNLGMAANFGISDKRYFRKKDTLNPWYISNKLQIEQTSKTFTSIERFRDVEFGREWNRSLYNPENGLDPKASGYVVANTEIGKGKGFAVYGGGGYNKSSGLQATNAKAGLRWNKKGFFAEPRAEWTDSKIGVVNNEFRKQYADAGYRKANGSLVFTAQKESSIFTNVANEQLPQNYGFRLLGATLNKQWKRWNLTVGAQDRLNQNLQLGSLKNASQARNVNFEASGRGKKNSYLKMGVTYREMHLLDTFFRNLYADENHIAGRLEYNFNKLLKAWSGNVFYQTISGREQQRQYSYFEVPAGQGFYTWLDFNGNGIKEVNEFQETPFKDQAKYVRLLVPTGTYIKAQGTEFTGNLLYQPALVIRKKNLGKLQNRITWNYLGKSTDSIWYKRISPFAENGNAASILSFNAFFRNLLEFETNNGKLMFQYNLQSRGSKLYFTNGFDTRTSLSNQFFGRVNILNKLQVRMGVERRNSDYRSEYVPMNNFEYEMNAVEPVFTFQPGTKFRIGLSGKLAEYQNHDVKIAELYEVGLQGNKTVGKSGMLEMKVSLLDARYHLTRGTTLAYDVLQGFSPGRNFRGTTDLRFNASKNIQMVISYEGRKTADAKFVHIGRAEARYLF
jgi:hypothetical protein